MVIINSFFYYVSTLFCCNVYYVNSVFLFIMPIYFLVIDVNADGYLRKTWRAASWSEWSLAGTHRRRRSPPRRNRTCRNPCRATPSSAPPRRTCCTSHCLEIEDKWPAYFSPSSLSTAWLCSLLDIGLPLFVPSNMVLWFWLCRLPMSLSGVPHFFYHISDTIQPISEFKWIPSHQFNPVIVKKPMVYKYWLYFSHGWG